METNKIHCADCLNILKDIPNESIDLVVSDIPYKIIAGGIRIENLNDECGGIFNKRVAVSDGTECSNKWLKKNNEMISAAKEGKMFQHNEIEFQEWLPDIYRVLKKSTHCYLMVNGRNLKELEVEAEKVGFIWQNLLVWDKGNTTPNKYYMGAVEFILMLSKRPARNVNDMGISNLLSIPNIIGNKDHPTQKPIPLLELLIKQSSDENDIVLDPFMGSGGTCLAARNLNRKYIGIEIDREYFDTADKKLLSLQNAYNVFFE